jgi:hypothetical protein
MDQLEQFDFIVIDNFIGQNWAAFVAFCQSEHDMPETEVEDLGERLTVAARQ